MVLSVLFKQKEMSVHYQEADLKRLREQPRPLPRRNVEQPADHNDRPSDDSVADKPAIPEEK